MVYVLCVCLTCSQHSTVSSSSPSSFILNQATRPIKNNGQKTDRNTQNMLIRHANILSRASFLQTLYSIASGDQGIFQDLEHGVSTNPLGSLPSPFPLPFPFPLPPVPLSPSFPPEAGGCCAKVGVLTPLRGCGKLPGGDTHGKPRSALHNRVISPGTFNNTILQSLPVYYQSGL